MAVRFGTEALGDLPKGVLCPRYDRASLRAGIVHIGLGNFHRAHQAWYTHRLMQQGEALDWAILGAGVRPNDAVMRETLIAQDCLTTLIELAPDSRSAEVNGAMIGYIPVESDNAALIRAMADPAIRIVSLTVTEGGYCLDAQGELDTSHVDIAHDAENPRHPRTAFGAMIAALRLRRDAGHGAFTGLSCDNLQGNGAILRQTVLGLARLSDPTLADWIGETCSFPNSMVDCIVPATGPDELALVRKLGIADAAPVTHENFRQWVIEDDFCAGRPDWDKVGATFSTEVHAHEAMKLRILNGGHQILANPGELLGVGTIAGCMAHPRIAALLNKVASTEIVPQVAPVPGVGPLDYLALTERRFANPAIRDTVRRVAFDGSSRHPAFILPTVREALVAGNPVEGLALVEALWARMCAGTREDGSAIEPNDPAWTALQPCAIRAKDSPAAWLGQTRIYDDLGRNTRFAEAFAAWLRAIWRDGTEPVLQQYLSAETVESDVRGRVRKNA